MPGKRADNVKVHNIGFEDDLWKAIVEKAAREGISASEAIRRLARGWVAE
jgi:hypothetical protein